MASSTYLDNTQKDLVGEATAIVILAAFASIDARHLPADEQILTFLRREAHAIRMFLASVVSAALVDSSLQTELTENVSDIVRKGHADYDAVRINALLSLYSSQRHLRDFCAEPELFTDICRKVGSGRLDRVFDAILRNRGYAVWRGANVDFTVGEFVNVYSTAQSLLGGQTRRDERLVCETVLRVIHRWPNLGETQDRAEGTVERAVLHLVRQIHLCCDWTNRSSQP